MLNRYFWRSIVKPQSLLRSCWVQLISERSIEGPTSMDNSIHWTCPTNVSIPLFTIVEAILNNASDWFMSWQGNWANWVGCVDITHAYTLNLLRFDNFPRLSEWQLARGRRLWFWWSEWLEVEKHHSSVVWYPISKVMIMDQYTLWIWILPSFQPPFPSISIYETPSPTKTSWPSINRYF